MLELKGRRIAVMLENMFNDSEFWYPVYRLREAGATVVAAGAEADRMYGGKDGLKITPDTCFSSLKAAALDGLVIPGGLGWNMLCLPTPCLHLVKSVYTKGKLVAFICTGGLVPLAAGILKGRRATSATTLRETMLNAGCRWEDNELVRDGNLLSSRCSDDLPVFMKAVIAFLTRKYPRGRRQSISGGLYGLTPYVRPRATA